MTQKKTSLNIDALKIQAYLFDILQREDRKKNEPVRINIREFSRFFSFSTKDLLIQTCEALELLRSHNTVVPCLSSSHSDISVAPLILRYEISGIPTPDNLLHWQAVIYPNYDAFYAVMYSSRAIIPSFRRAHWLQSTTALYLHALIHFCSSNTIPFEFPLDVLAPALLCTASENVSDISSARDLVGKAVCDINTHSCLYQISSFRLTKQGRNKPPVVSFVVEPRKYQSLVAGLTDFDDIEPDAAVTTPDESAAPDMAVHEGIIQPVKKKSSYRCPNIIELRTSIQKHPQYSKIYRALRTRSNIETKQYQITETMCDIFVDLCRDAECQE